MTLLLMFVIGIVCGVILVSAWNVPSEGDEPSQVIE
jgi:hypothetical protein